MVFQQFNLFPHKTAVENIMVSPMLVKKESKEEAYRKAVSLLNRVGLPEKETAYRLAFGGQQQVLRLPGCGHGAGCVMFDEPTSAWIRMVGEVRAL